MVTASGAASTNSGRHGPLAVVPVEDRIPRVRGANPAALCQRAAQMLQQRSAAQFDPETDRVAAVLAAAAASLNARPGSLTARLAGRAVSARIVDLATSIAGQHQL